ncbi:hypothetical protein D3C78_1469140 [compost metagenome]
MNFHFENCFFTRQVFSMISFRESYSYVFEITSCQTNNLLFKSRDKRAAAKFQGVTFCFAAFKRNTINGTVEINHYSVTILSCFIVDYNEFSMTLLQTLKLLVQFFFANFNVYSWNFNSFVVAKLNFWLNSNFSFEFESLSFFELLYVNFRTVHREDLSLINCL